MLDGTSWVTCPGGRKKKGKLFPLYYKVNRTEKYFGICRAWEFCLCHPMCILCSAEHYAKIWLFTFFPLEFQVLAFPTALVPALVDCTRE